MLYRYSYNFSAGTQVSGSFAGLVQDFDFDDVPVQKQVLASSCTNILEGEVNEILESVSYSKFNSGRFIGVINVIANSSDYGDLYIEENNDVYVGINRNGIGDYEKIGTISFDVSAKTMQLNGNRKLTEEFGGED